MAEFSIGDSDPAGRPWLSDDQVLMHIPCQPGQEAAVVGFMRGMPVEHYVEAQAFFEHPEESLVGIILAAYKGVARHPYGETEDDETDFFGGINIEPATYSGTIADSLTLIEYLQSLEEIPHREQFDGLCEDHGSYWMMAEGPKTDPANSKVLDFVALTLRAYQEYGIGERKIIMLPESVFSTIERIAEENSPEAIQAKEEEFKQALQYVMDFLGPISESTQRLLEQAEQAT
ncbi:MAG TPA: hypothetical protein VIJ68_00265 [Candidatus Saccharimonadales bacterium]